MIEITILVYVLALYNIFELRIETAGLNSQLQTVLISSNALHGTKEI